MRRHTGAQLRHAKWLRQVIVAAKAQSAQNVRFLRSCGKKQDGAPCQGADARAGGKAVLAGHHHIQQDAVRPCAVLRRHLRSACQRRYSMAVPLHAPRTSARISESSSTTRICATVSPPFQSVIASINTKATKVRTKRRRARDRTHKEILAACAGAAALPIVQQHEHS